jgi:aspartyl-tRNA synthetase
MTSVDEVIQAITAKGDQIRQLKAEKPPTLKEDLAPLITELAALKLQYKELSGEEWDAPKEVKKKAAPEQPQTTREGPSKSELNKMKRKEARAEAKAKAGGEGANESSKSNASASATANEEESTLYGDAPLVQSQCMTEKNYRRIEDIQEDRAGQVLWVRGRLSNSRNVGKGVFLILRQGIHTMQAVIYPDGDKVTKSFVKYAASIAIESIIDIQAKVVIPETPILSTTIKNIELAVQEIHVISSASELPFMVDDAGRNEDEAKEKTLPTVLQDTCLNYRWVDLRTPANQAIFRIQSGVCQLFRDFFLSRNFIEIHTPKLIGGASEGGSNVFTLKYFDQPACLAQSPQLYKQMVAACAGFERVFEIGPVFRAENSNTHRHLCEFTGLDFEMAIYEHYYEALSVRRLIVSFNHWLGYDTFLCRFCLTCLFSSSMGLRTSINQN